MRVGEGNELGDWRFGGGRGENEIEEEEKQELSRVRNVIKRNLKEVRTYLIKKNSFREQECCIDSVHKIRFWTINKVNFEESEITIAGTNKEMM